MGVGGVTSDFPPSYEQTFETIFPYYLSIGMTYEQFWYQNCDLVKAYRKAEELRQRRRNQELWLQGRYIYDALCAVSPVLHAFAKNGTQPQPYLEKPYPSDKEESKAREQEQMENQAEAFRQYVEAFNTMRHKRKEVVTDGKH